MHDEGFGKIGIIGGGKMGRSIFMHLQKFPYPLIWYNRSTHEAESIKYQKRIHRMLAAGAIQEEEARIMKERVSIEGSLASQSQASLIIEAIPEDLDAKNKIFSDLMEILPRHAILTSNSSSLLPERFTLPVMWRERFAVMHFFFPVETNNLLEIIPARETKAEVVSALGTLSLAWGKRALIQHHDSAFASNRYFLEIQADLFHFCRENHIPFAYADEVVKTHLFPMGIFEMMDHIGFRVLSASIENYIKMTAEPGYKQELLDYIRLGLKTHEDQTSYPRFVVPGQEAFQETSLGASEILGFVHSSFRKYALEYIDNHIFTKEELEFMITEYTQTEYSPFNDETLTI